MKVTLETLEIAPQDLPAVREEIQRMAYFKWIQAGRPEGEPLEFWKQAERDWIEQKYVPHRPLDGDRPAFARPEEAPAAAPRNEPVMAASGSRA